MSIALLLITFYRNRLENYRSHHIKTIRVGTKLHTPASFNARVTSVFTDKLALPEKLEMRPEEVVHVAGHQLLELLLVNGAQVHTWRTNTHSQWEAQGWHTGWRERTHTHATLWSVGNYRAAGARTSHV